jgi:acyl-CoA synthetase (NDP forming)
MADAILGTRYQLEIPALSEATAQRISNVLAEQKLASLVNVRNPLDLTPMANEKAYEGCIRAMLEDESIDAVIASIVPLTPQLLTTADEILEETGGVRAGSVAERLPALFNESPKPMICVVDSGPPYDALAQTVRAAGVPVVRTSDQAVRSLGRYLCHQSEGRPKETAEISEGGPPTEEKAERPGYAHA